MPHAVRPSRSVTRPSRARSSSPVRACCRVRRHSLRATRCSPVPPAARARWPVSRVATPLLARLDLTWAARVPMSRALAMDPLRCAANRASPAPPSQRRVWPSTAWPRAVVRFAACATVRLKSVLRARVPTLAPLATVAVVRSPSPMSICSRATLRPDSSR